MNYVSEKMPPLQQAKFEKKGKYRPVELEAKASPTPGEWCVGIVQAGGDDCLQISSGGFQARARRAVSCLVEPANGDSVACLRVAPDEVWIVAVLHREEGVANVLSCTGNTTLRVSQGGLQIEADTLKLNSEHLHIASKDAQVATESVQVIGKQLRVIGTTIKVVGAVMSTVMERVNHYSKHYLRTTEGIDRVSATHIECEAQQLMRLDAEHTLVSGAQLIKARGAQIHFG
jgi:hypothetical protein